MQSEGSTINELAIKTTKILEDEIILELIYTPQDVAMLKTKDEMIKLRAFRSDSIQSNLLLLLINNPGLAYTRKELLTRRTLKEKSPTWKHKENKKFASFANGFKISRILRELFFGVETIESNDNEIAKITLTNPITRSYIEQSCYTIEQVNQEIEKHELIVMLITCV